MMKYRIWDETRKEYVQDYDDFYINPDGELSIISLMWEGEQEWCKPDRYILEQYTGLKDKNGKEIYEGDVVSNGRDYGVLTFKWGCFNVIPIHNKNLFLPVWEFDVTCTLNVIGNIHENPELLEVQ